MLERYNCLSYLPISKVTYPDITLEKMSWRKESLVSGIVSTIYRRRESSLPAGKFSHASGLAPRGFPNIWIPRELVSKLVCRLGEPRGKYSGGIMIRID